MKAMYGNFFMPQIFLRTFDWEGFYQPNAYHVQQK